MNDDSHDAVAAEYVLGTLSADEREHAETLLAIDPDFADKVRMWERRLGELNVMVEAIEPPPEVWDKIRTELGEIAPIKDIAPSAGEAASSEAEAKTGIEAAAPEALANTAIEASSPEPPTQTAGEAALPEPPIKTPSGNEAPSQPDAMASSLLSPSADLLAGQGTGSATVPLAPSLAEPPPERSAPVARPRIERSAEVVYLARRVARLQRVAVAATAIAAVLAIYVAVSLFAPGLVPLGRFLPAQLMAQSPQSPAGPAAQLVAVLKQEPTAPAFLLTIDPQSRTMIVRRVAATPEPGRSYELWLIARRFPTPRSLGIVGNDEFTQRQIPGGFDVDTLRAANYAVSLEPAGGSPSGVPTGPILFTGKMVESVPASAPPTPRT